MRIFEDAPVDEIIRARRSVRTYEHQPVEKEVRSRIKTYIETLETPFGGGFAFRLLESSEPVNGAKLGTYGIIRGATDYIGVTVKRGESAELSVGYAFEQLILFLTSLGLGTCWMGGTFRRSEFAKAMEVQGDDLFPAISPFGHGAQKRSLSDSLVRYLAKGNQRKPWEELFFDGDFNTPLSRLEAGVYELPLEMVRLAPSASNKQPWRVVRQEDGYHFYLAKTPGYGEALAYDIQKMDMGIAACHFNLVAMEKNLSGHFRTLTPEVRDIPQNTRYVFSWIRA
jgi:nitroreductase